MEIPISSSRHSTAILEQRAHPSAQWLMAQSQHHRWLTVLMPIIPISSPCFLASQLLGPARLRLDGLSQKRNQTEAS